VRQKGDRVQLFFIITFHFPLHQRDLPEMDSTNTFPAKIIQIHQNNDYDKKLLYLKAFKPFGLLVIS
jgi:hypothetical protein